MAMGRSTATIVLMTVCLWKCCIAQACRSSVSLNVVPEARPPYMPLRQTRVQLASTLSFSAQKTASLDTASSILALLGGAEQAASVPPDLSAQILPYLRFLVTPDLPGLAHLCSPARSPARHKILYNRVRSLLRRKGDAPEPFSQKEETLVDGLIHWPPTAVSELARKVVEWNGDPSVILNSLNPESRTVPDVEGANEQHCQLTKYTHGQRFLKEELNHYFAFLFEAITALAPSVEFNITLSRFDLFHGHLFLANTTGRLGILFHAREYPAYNEKTFPVHLGYCQVGSPLPYDDTMNLRNILWLAPMPDCSNKTCSKEGWLAPGSLLVLDAHPDGIIYKDLVPDYVDVVRTVYEDDFGDVVVDVNYFNNPDDKLKDRLFIC